MFEIFKRLRALEIRQVELEAKLEAHAKDHSWLNYTKTQEDRLKTMEELTLKLLKEVRADKEPETGQEGGPPGGRYI